ncbi:MAG: hypothetical protein CMH83_17980 [Nocardioides sp.]|nr:hypothetical protein [Nocardioides sp.]
MPHVYILRCADDSYYVGSTVDLDRRLWQHQEGEGSAYTRPRRRRPVELAWGGWFDRIGHAFAFEKRVQGWGRAKREALIDGRMDDLPALARKDFSRRRAAPTLRSSSSPAGRPPVFE